MGMGILLMNPLKRFGLWLDALKLQYYDFKAPMCFHRCSDTRQTMIYWSVYDEKGQPVKGECPECKVTVYYDKSLRTLKDHLDDAFP